MYDLDCSKNDSMLAYMDLDIINLFPIPLVYFNTYIKPYTYFSEIATEKYAYELDAWWL